ncbi:hypothetical protein [Flagellimonas sp. S3867]|uniref:hypothetical protein n=1 Tax=Flagellimonas sp. S3867 TaxID=2768063 RepID=UPI001684E2A5|nr:hypothetical protein [Flagellimonas sp. S3867]
MGILLKIFNWKSVNLIIFFTLLVLIVLNFYGIYTNRFYFLKPDNFIIPILGIVHFLYLYVIWFKISEGELPDPKMRNLEYAVYAILIVYLFKIYDSAMVVNSYSQFQEHVLPTTFRPISIITLVLYTLLTPLTLLSFWYRKRLVGAYKFDDYNNNLNVWQ